MLLPIGGDVRIKSVLLTGLQIGGAAVTRICREIAWKPAGVGQGPLEPGQQMHRIAGLVAHADGHDHLVISIDSGLAVVALNPAVVDLENVAVGVGDVALGLGSGVAGGIGGQLAAWHRQWIRICASRDGDRWCKASGPNLLKSQLLGIVGPLAGTTGSAHRPLAGSGVIMGLSFGSLPLRLLRLLQSLASLGGSDLCLQLGFGLADPLQPALTPLQLFGQPSPRLSLP